MIWGELKGHEVWGAGREAEKQGATKLDGIGAYFVSRCL